MSSRGLPDVLMQKVDDYVDSLAPQIQPRIASELETFQQKSRDASHRRVQITVQQRQAVFIRWQPLWSLESQ